MAAIDETGNTYVCLMVLRRASSSDSWICQCSCGKLTMAKGYALRHGGRKTCGCRSHLKTKPAYNLRDEIGAHYGRLTVIERAPENQGSNARWVCLCACGNKTTVAGANLRSGNTRSCGCLHKESAPSRLPTGQAAFNRLYAVYRRGANRRGLHFGLTKGQFRVVTQQCCHYCGKPPEFLPKRDNTNGAYRGNGVDRVDNGSGYSVDNAVPCCAECNRAKCNSSVEEFLSHVALIHLNHPVRPDKAAGL